MGILNRTTDSSMTTGSYFQPGPFLRACGQLVREGADVLDVGGVKAGPGPEVTEAEELERVVPVIAALHDRFDVPLSVDTWRASVAAAAFAAGASLGNDISGFADPEYLAVAASAGAAVVATHIRLAPRCPIPTPHYDDVVAEVERFLLERADRAMAAGSPPIASSSTRASTSARRRNSRCCCCSSRQGWHRSAIPCCCRRRTRRFSGSCSSSASTSAVTPRWPRRPSGSPAGAGS